MVIQYSRIVIHIPILSSEEKKKGHHSFLFTTFLSLTIISTASSVYILIPFRVKISSILHVRDRHFSIRTAKTGQDDHDNNHTVLLLFSSNASLSITNNTVSRIFALLTYFCSPWLSVAFLSLDLDNHEEHRARPILSCLLNHGVSIILRYKLENNRLFSL